MQAELGILDIGIYTFVNINQFILFQLKSSHKWVCEILRVPEYLYPCLWKEETLFNTERSLGTARYYRNGAKW